MRWRVLAAVSLGANLVLAAVLLSSMKPAAPRSTGSALASASATNTAVRTNTLVRRQFFTWQEVESPDYQVYIANLRFVGCPEQTIRDIIIADVNALYARRRANELLTPEQQWWRSEPDTAVLQAAFQKSRELEDERRGLLTRLLGTNWETGDLVSLPRPSRPGVVLDGPVLGALPVDVKQSIQGINARSDERLEAYLEAQRAAGKPADPVEMAKLRQQTRDELARVLPPAPLEEYLLRYSQTANDLRDAFGKLQYFDPTAEEFRAVFRATDSIEQQLALLANSTDPNAVQARQALELQRENALKLALGSNRYQEYTLLHDPRYQEAVAAAQEAGTPEAARVIYQVNLAAASMQDSISNNAALTDEQKAIELKQLELDQLKAKTLATGRDLPPDPQTPPPRRTYTLRTGDTPGIVGMIYGLPESAIRAANPNIDFNRLRPGDSINIPRDALAPSFGPVTSPTAR